MLRNADIETPYLDILVLTADLLGYSKEKLLAYLEDPFPEQLENAFWKIVHKRILGNPVSYLVQRKDFYAHTFKVGPGVLVPRPDTEILVEEARKCISVNGFARIHDLCTGSGCIAISLKKVFPDAYISASDISEEALDYFKQNAKEVLGSVIPVYRTNLLEGITGPFDVIISNPPYLTTDEINKMKADNWPEPIIALHGGDDGLNFIRKIIPDAYAKLSEGGYLFLESSSIQTGPIAELFMEQGFTEVKIINDYGHRPRAICGRRSVRE